MPTGSSIHRAMGHMWYTLTTATSWCGITKNTHQMAVYQTGVTYTKSSENNQGPMSKVSQEHEAISRGKKKPCYSI